jgi:hypothetical protein
VKLNKLSKPEELKEGMTIVSVDKGMYQAIEKIECIDNGLLYSECLVTGHSTPKGSGEKVEDYFDPQYYDSVYEVKGE